MGPGTLVADRYEVGHLVAHGGMASVHRAHDRVLRRDVAIKSMTPALAADVAARRRFVDEARTAAGIDHPGLVGVHDAGEHDGVPWFVMDLVDGPSLEDVLHDGPMEVTAALAAGAELADALAAVHDAGLVHRDVKPSNVLFGADGRARLADFGVAAAHGADLTTVMGSATWAAPEVANGTVDPRSDVYALGCVLTAMLTGEAPYDAPTPTGQMLAHREAPLPSLRDRNRAIAPEVEDLVLRMLAKSPDERPGDLRRVAERLSAAAPVDDATTILPPPDATRVMAVPRADGDVPAPPMAPTSRRALLTSIAAGAGLAVVVGLLLLLVSRLAAPGPSVEVSTPTATVPSPAASSTPTPTPTASTPTPTPTPTPTRPADLRAAVVDLRSLLAAGRDDGRVSRSVEDAIDERLDKVVEELQKAEEERGRADTDSIHDKLDEVGEEIDKGVESGGLDDALAVDLRRTLAQARDLVPTGLGRDRGEDDDEDDDR